MVTKSKILNGVIFVKLIQMIAIFVVIIDKWKLCQGRWPNFRLCRKNYINKLVEYIYTYDENEYVFYLLFKYAHKKNFLMRKLKIISNEQREKFI